jgi:hypothetical protein
VHNNCFKFLIIKKNKKKLKKNQNFIQEWIITICIKMDLYQGINMIKNWLLYKAIGLNIVIPWKSNLMKKHFFKITKKLI